MLTRRLIGATSLALLARPALAQWQPTRPIRVLVGFAPGGGTDITTRTIGGKMQTLLGQPIIVENRPGAGGNIASEATVNAPADGSVLMMGTIASLVMNPIMTPLSFDVLTDLTTIGRSVEVTNVFVVPADRPWRSLPEVIAAARARPDTLTYGSSGVGGAGHVGGALLDSMADIKTVHVPYRGGGQLITDIISGKVDFSIATAATVLPHIESGRLRALAVPTARRSPLLPNVPTVAEAASLPGYEVANWYGMMGPRALPRPIVERVHGALVESLRDPDVVASLAGHGLEPAPSTPEEFTEIIRAETAKWRPILARAGANAN
ncbi:Bug family tripartite tricarboxylate transporter substrate binding protein [Neoroseomonas lacus]|uniref:MFS transporter n=1 Tax=Neoroseomonas lacus TaxID=287609 RepID=A0A917K910_9PROT|nr:tripartite tricarboxylate transporter substrate binding protein [Neoroseomonas lacus]GGJ02810.1 MFS transporter [Neoroseomonas lacus]